MITCMRCKARIERAAAIGLIALDSGNVIDLCPQCHAEWIEASMQFSFLARWPGRPDNPHHFDA